MLNCYNRGCGQEFDSNNNKDDSCRHHPGVPVFHDAYKGWSCCKKKSVDFTEFLNIKGCTLSKHSNEKPSEPEKPQNPIEVADIPSPAKQIEPIKVALKRPSFEIPLVRIEPTVVPALKEAVDAIIPKIAGVNLTGKKDSQIEKGTICKNGGCNRSYEGSESNETECRYHPGHPIFHEGLKFWSCCTKRTTDFTAFMNQPGCTTGKHKWIQENNNKTKINCRYDWMQTSKHVTVAIYAKLYHYAKSTIKVNPIRLNVSLLFPDQNNAKFDLDLELRGIIIVEETMVKMFGTKIEITMPKAEPGSWTKLDFPKRKDFDGDQKSLQNVEQSESRTDASDGSDIDLDDIEPAKGVQITNIS